MPSLEFLHAAFLLVALSGACYFLLARRVFDVWALAFFGACFYFIPGFVGFAGYAQGLLLLEKPLVPGTYLVMIVVLLAFLLAGILMSDRVGAVVLFRSADSLASPFAYGAVLCGAIGLILTILSVGAALVSGDKFALLGELNRWHLMWTSGASLALVAAVRYRLSIAIALALFLHLANVYIGFRVDLVIAVIASVYLLLRSVGAQRLISRWRMIAGVTSLALAMFLLKYFLVAIQLMDIDLMVSQATNPDILKNIFLYSEPFVAQGTLNEVISSEYWTGPSHLSGNFYLLVPFANELGAQTTGFNDLFQPALFSSVTDYGLGSNIWAEMVAAGGPMLLLLFIGALIFVLSLLQVMADRMSVFASVVGALLVAYWAFYVHRNDLLYQFTLTRRYIMAALAVLLIAVLIRWLMEVRRALASGYVIDPRLLYMGGRFSWGFWSRLGSTRDIFPR